MAESRTNPRHRFRFSLKLLFLLVTLAGIFFAVNTNWYRFTYDDYYYVEMTEKVDFQGWSCHVFVILEEGRKTPTWRQRMLIYRLQRYDASLLNKIHDSADENRIEFEGLVGDLHKEYGLPIMNRQNIHEHYQCGLVWIPRLSDSADDFIVLGCSCDWEVEHGMELLIKNGSSVPWHGDEGPWQWSTPTEALRDNK